jgi:hypothetical protein
MSDILASSRAKVAHAEEQLERFWTQLKSFMEAQPFSARSQTNLRTNDVRIVCRYFVDKFTPVPEDWPLVLGDALHNLRAALDHATWSLLANANGDAWAWDNRRRIDFPIYKEETHFTGDFVVKNVPVDLVSTLKACQPFHCTPVAPQTDALWVLEQAEVLDKHRALNIIALHPDNASFTVWPELPDGRFQWVEQGALRPGAEVARFTAPRPIVGPGLTTELKLQCVLGIEPPPDGALIPLDPGLHEIVARVKEAIRLLSLSLPSPLS